MVAREPPVGDEPRHFGGRDVGDVERSVVDRLDLSGVEIDAGGHEAGPRELHGKRQSRRSRGRPPRARRRASSLPQAASGFHTLHDRAHSESSRTGSVPSSVFLKRRQKAVRRDAAADATGRLGEIRTPAPAAAPAPTSAALAGGHVGADALCAGGRRGLLRLRAEERYCSARTRRCSASSFSRARLSSSRWRSASRARRARARRVSSGRAARWRSFARPRPPDLSLFAAFGLAHGCVRRESIRPKPGPRHGDRRHDRLVPFPGSAPGRARRSRRGPRSPRRRAPVDLGRALRRSRTPASRRRSR